MGFDLQNFGLGLLAGWISAYGVYRARRQIANAAAAVRGRANDIRRSATRSADSRYAYGLIEMCETSHLAGTAVRLSSILVEPRFLTAPDLPAPPADDVVHSVFHIVPRVHDHPYLHAAYNLETLSVDDLAAGTNAIALLGLPGSGRTTALLTIALRSMRRIQFERQEDRVQQQIDAEEAALNEKERAARIKERTVIEQRARDRLREQHGITFETEAEQQRKDHTPRFSRYMPVYLHLANLVVEASGQLDPAEPLVRAVQFQLGGVAASTIPANLYRRLNLGQVLLLVDGYDELPAAEQPAKLAWLEAFIDAYGDNFVIAAGPASGYAPLTSLGLTPVFLRPWSGLDCETLVRRWAEAWPLIAGTRRSPAPSPSAAALEAANRDNRARPPADLTLKTWASLSNPERADQPASWFNSFLARSLPTPYSLDEILPMLAQAGALQLDEGFITLGRLVDRTYTPTMAWPADGAERDDQPSAAHKGAVPASGSAADLRKAEAEERKQRDAFVKTQRDMLKALLGNGLLVRFAGERLRFRHSHIAAYLASLTLKAADSETLEQRAHDSAWGSALMLAALHSPLDSAVRARLSAPASVLANGALEVSRWLAYAPPDVPWRGPLLKHLGNMLVAPAQFPLLRERAAAALLGTRDPNVLFIFRQAVRNVNADVRRLACLGLGALGVEEAIRDLAPLLGDQVPDVQLAAGLGLGAIGTEAALEEMVITLTEGSERLRQAVTEALAALPDEGHPLLYEAITHEDMMVRRAATFGLKRIRASWAMTALYRAFLEDPEWYVRSAAQQAFQEIQQEEQRGPRAYPPVEWVPWLGAWAASRGEDVPTGEAAWEMLLRALHEGEPQIRKLAAATIGHLGEIRMARQLYDALRDRDEEVRTAAHASLGFLQAQSGLDLPAPA